MRTLIVGAGIGGLTLAGLLAQRGERPVVIEKAPDFDHAGYMLGLYPLGSRVLHGLGLHPRFVEVSQPLARYQIADGRGRVLRTYSFDAVSERFGAIRDLTRPELVRLLGEALGDLSIRMRTSIETLEAEGDEVVAGFSDGSRERFDLVVGADGIHSRVRSLVFGEAAPYHTGWGGWVYWADPRLAEPEMAVEYWGAGRFLGLYPTRQRLGVFAAFPSPPGIRDPPEGRAARLRARFESLGEPARAVLDGLPDDREELFFWSLSDLRSREWVRGRVVLLGDAAAGFLPTAGVGASMAMESAAVLADELSRADAARVPSALALFVARRRRRVEAMQDESRKLARFMFVRSRPMAALRDQLAKRYSNERLTADFSRYLGEPI